MDFWYLFVPFVVYGLRNQQNKKVPFFAWIIEIAVYRVVGTEIHGHYQSKDQVCSSVRFLLYKDIQVKICYDDKK